MRRSALLLNLHRTTVKRKVQWLAKWARVDHDLFLKRLPQFPEVQFDEMETFEHTKCKPVSVPLVVTKKERIILSYSVASMPAKGKLAKISLKKYGKRKDDRRAEIISVLEKAKTFVEQGGTVMSDECPRYPPLVKKILPHAMHKKTKGRRGCIVGQGELKKVGKDPLFYLNHSCAMVRANVSRTVRKTWATTKKIDALADHLAIYVHFHNQILLSLSY